MKEKNKIGTGTLSHTSEYHRSIGSSGAGFEALIEGDVKPDVPFGEQMTNEALKEYYDMQLGGVRGYFKLPADFRKDVMPIALGFEADLPYLESRGIDTTEAKSVFEELKKL